MIENDKYLGMFIEGLRPQKILRIICFSDLIHIWKLEDEMKNRIREGENNEI